MGIGSRLRMGNMSHGLGLFRSVISARGSYSRKKCTITEGRRVRDTRHTIAYEIFFFFHVCDCDAETTCS